MKIKNVILAVMVLGTLCFSSAFSACAQSKTLPIDSLASAVSYDLLHVQSVYGQLYSPSFLNTNGVKTFWWQAYNPNGVPKIGDLMAMVATNPFAFMLARPTNDWINAYFSYNSADGDQLFYANAEFQLIQSNGVWQVPASVSTNLADMIGYYEPIYETNAIGAHLNLRDGSGNLLQTIYLTVNQMGTGNAHVGKILNQTTYLGQHGETVVTYGQFDQWGNQTNSYDVAFANDEDKGGVAIAPVSGSVAFNPSWDGLVKPLSPPMVLLTNVPSVNHIGQSPLVQIIVTNTMAVYFHADTIEGEVANGFTIKLLQTGLDLPPVPYTNSVGSIGQIVQLPPGTYHIDFKWPQLAPQQAYPYWYGGGAGAGGVTVATPIVPEG